MHRYCGRRASSDMYEPARLSSRDIRLPLRRNPFLAIVPPVAIPGFVFSRKIKTTVNFLFDAGA
ncbi:MAG: hypothetical protein U0264_09300 [Candidatus Kapaibacterium sp.]